MYQITYFYVCVAVSHTYLTFIPLDVFFAFSQNRNKKPIKPETMRGQFRNQIILWSRVLVSSEF